MPRHALGQSGGRMTANAAIYFHQDGYVVDRADLKGRHAAGHGYLRAHIAGMDAGTPVTGTGPAGQASAFGKLVAEISPTAKPAWIAPLDLGRLSSIGALSLPGPSLTDAANLRLRIDPAAYSLIGITHTTASHHVMDDIASLLSAPIMPWDALICTSAAVRATVDAILCEARAYLAWRHGTPSRVASPQLPVIPLGVHTSDYAFTAHDRAAARANLAIADDEIVLLFVGRLSFHAKAHPHAMYTACEAVARRTGKRIVLIQSGWFANDAIKQAFEQGAAAWCPSVRALFADGRNADARTEAWRAADIFVSLSDNIQETFGLTPIEAMAAGLPCLVTDWNGYRDTVRDGIDGFRIATAMPAAPATDHLAVLFEAGALSYDHYCGQSSLTVSLDHARLEATLEALILQPDLRARLGGSGRKRAQDTYDWAVVFQQHRALWQHLSALRSDLSKTMPAAPRFAPARPDPARAFATYPTVAITGATRVTRTASPPDLAKIAADPLYPKPLLPDPKVWTHAQAVLTALPPGTTLSLAACAKSANVPLRSAILTAALLLKIGALRLELDL